MRLVASFRFRRLAQFRHGLQGSPAHPAEVSAAAGGARPATGQVLGATAHLQRAREPAAHRVAAGEKLLGEVARPAALPEEGDELASRPGGLSPADCARRPRRAGLRLPGGVLWRGPPCGERRGGYFRGSIPVSVLLPALGFWETVLYLYRTPPAPIRHRLFFSSKGLVPITGGEAVSLTSLRCLGGREPGV